MFSVQRVIAQRVLMLKPLMKEAFNETEAGEISKEQQENTPLTKTAASCCRSIWTHLSRLDFNSHALQKCYNDLTDMNSI